TWRLMLPCIRFGRACSRYSSSYRVLKESQAVAGIREGLDGSGETAGCSSCSWLLLLAGLLPAACAALIRMGASSPSLQT
ncbi:hypothetical protein, partial [Azotobacter beijerinckii]|uniref:hypothetical protein n=1 Tax=Azotobacter beijerinckii TaxID=170623 RepID=UPI001C314AAA